MTVQEAATILGATPADIAGLWNAPGYPELTSNQLVQIARQRGSETGVTGGRKASVIVFDEYFKPAS